MKNHGTPTRKLVKSSIDFISLRSLTVNKLCRERTAHFFQNPSWRRGPWPTEVSQHQCFCEARMLGRHMEHPHTAARGRGSGALQSPLQHRHAFARQKPSMVAPGLRGCPLRGFARPVLPSALGTSFCSVCWRGDAAPSRRRLAAALAAGSSRWLMSRLGASSCWFDYDCFIS